MNSLFRMIKRNARVALKDRWGQADAIVLLAVAITMLFSLAESTLSLFFDIPLFTDVANTPGLYLDDLPATTAASFTLSGGILFLSALVLVPLNLGIVQWYRNVVYGRKEELGTIFTFFDSIHQIFRSLWAAVLLTVRRLLWGLLLFSPSILLFWMSGALSGSNATRMDQMMAAFGSLMGTLLALVSGLLFWAVWQRYYLVLYLLCADRTCKVHTAIHQSIQLTRGKLGDILLFRLSFIGWHLANLLVLPILYTWPYLQTSYAMMACYLQECRREEMPHEDHSLS